ncbi:hypothetical protein Glove_151g147 [Diversispora epigaea]|uniref:Serine-threonine/tyrosine-protein kinase catalytic domain-containing protein n=1 Tax=Diversispora epigaea TaxID=1348612 RepID=A0A397J2I0_9GLOM|nr:hypothetical protein Glove_151g147 [Diversispora epigaea]
MSKQSSLAMDDTHPNSDTYHPLSSPVIFVFLVPPQYIGVYIENSMLRFCLYSSLLVNRIWCEVNMPILWELSFGQEHYQDDMKLRKRACIRTYISCTDTLFTQNGYDLSFPSPQATFDYPSSLINYFISIYLQQTIGSDQDNNESIILFHEIYKLIINRCSFLDYFISVGVTENFSKNFCNYRDSELIRPLYESLALICDNILIVDSYLYSVPQINYWQNLLGKSLPIEQFTSHQELYVEDCSGKQKAIKVCTECNEEYKDQDYWCKLCNSTRFKNDFDKWASENDTIDKFIQNNQLKANWYNLIEWLPYDRFQDIKPIAKGGFGTIYYAIWVDGYLVVLKNLNGIVDINEDFLNEFKECVIWMAILARTNDGELSTVVFYGITREPETREYMMVLKYYEGGSLRNYFNNGLNNIILGGEKYKKKANVYSFSFVAYEIITYHDESHDKDLAFKICNGFRPKIPFHAPKLITQMIMRCWNARITHRPTFEELNKELDKYLEDYCKNGFDNSNEITIQIKEAEEFSKNKTTTDTTITTPVNYKSRRLLNFSNLPNPKNEENFEKKLEELTESFYQINASDDDDDLDTSNL